MNREQILAIAEECGIEAWRDTLCRYEGWEEPMIAFAARIEAAAREQAKDMMLVPKKPTKEMMEAWFRAYDEQQWNANSWESAFDVAYTAMFAAAIVTDAIRKSEG
jgi:hypothetical protein